MNIVCLGDSITQCQGAAEAERWTARLAFLLEGRAPGKHRIFNRGIGGNTTAMALDRIEADLGPALPGAVLIEFGINDAYVFLGKRAHRVGLAEYRANLAEIVRWTRAKGGTPVMIVNHPITLRKDLHPQGNGRSVGQNAAPYYPAARAVAARLKVPRIDLPELLRKEKAFGPSFYAEDGVHLSPAGNRLYAEVVFAGLKRLRIA